MGQSRPLFPFIFVFSTCYNLNSNLNWKKHRWCAWESNPGQQDGRREWIHWATAAPLIISCLFAFLVWNLLSHFANLFYFAPCNFLINRQQIIRIFGIIKTPLNWCPKMVIIKKSKYLIVSLKFKLKCKPDAKLRWALGELNRSGIILWRSLIREKAPTLRLNFHSNFFIETLPIHFLPNHDSS